jgi:hypothetical protein
MSGAPGTNNPANTTAKAAAATVSDSNSNSKPLQPQNKAAQLEEDDEFEDFPVEGKYFPYTATLETMSAPDQWPMRNVADG